MTAGSRLRKTALLAALSLVIQGCAIPGKVVTETIRIETPGCAKVSCELSNDRGTWRLPRTPGTVTLSSSDAMLNLTCRADNGLPFSFGVPSSTAAPTSTGALVGGAAGGVGIGAAMGGVALTFIPVLGAIVLLTGAAVGAAAGSAVESSQRPIHYPALITVPMSCPEAGEAPTPVGAGLGLGIRGLPLAQARESGLGDRGGVLVTTVVEGSPAAAAGLRAGDIILGVGEQELGDARDMEQRVNVLAPGAALALRVWREGRALELVVTRPAAGP